MKKPALITAAAMLLTALLPFTALKVPEVTVQAADTVKIMPVGDSITFGYGDEGGYRKFLNVFLREKNINFDMVGPEGRGNASFNYNGQQVNYDDNHAGY
ncbi:MAG: acetylxylan esterase, partial [Oscillospiraceae bacterium]|nr:acetylxylan esterase [Oscillospiraceae bacterium]